MKRWEIDLQRFSEAGGAEAAAGATAAGAGSGAEAAAGTGATGADAASQRAESGAKVVYGIQPGAAQGTADAAQGGQPASGTGEGAVGAEAPAAPANREAEWQKLINGEYREQFQKQVRDRLKTAVDDTENVGCDFHFGLHEANTMLEWGINHETGFVYSKLHLSAK